MFERFTDEDGVEHCARFVLRAVLGAVICDMMERQRQQQSGSNGSFLRCGFCWAEAVPTALDQIRRLRGYFWTMLQPLLWEGELMFATDERLQMSRECATCSLVCVAMH